MSASIVMRPTIWDRLQDLFAFLRWRRPAAEVASQSMLRQAAAQPRREAMIAAPQIEKMADVEIVRSEPTAAVAVALVAVEAVAEVAAAPLVDEFKAAPSRQPQLATRLQVIAKHNVAASRAPARNAALSNRKGKQLPRAPRQKAVRKSSPAARSANRPVVYMPARAAR